MYIESKGNFAIPSTCNVRLNWNKINFKLTELIISDRLRGRGQMGLVDMDVKACLWTCLNLVLS